ncbi:MAG TPA: response regulator [Myxococcaceae bacterium]|nr:response regulator [Myxococcaceae bacterium]
MSHKVLVVEDDTDIRQALEEILEDHGFRAVGVRHGAEALEFLSRADELPCLILLDLMMPVMDGATFRDEQRRDPRIASIPVVLLSAYRDLDQRAVGLDAVSVVNKPPNVRELVKVVRAHC